MKITTVLFIIFLTLGFMLLACSNYTESRQKVKSQQPVITPLEDSFMTDIRDGERYAVVKIGEQIWMAENLRYECEGSMFNESNPSKKFGRYYKFSVLQTVCPKGWHMPSDQEWDTLELAHGMPASFVGKGGWRGEHAVNLKSAEGWAETPREKLKEGWLQIGNGTNLLGLNIIPSGYYFPEELGEVGGMQGGSHSAAFWSSQETVVTNGAIVKRAYARFIFAERKFVNKWPDDNDNSGAALSCRCIKD